ncbi:MAG TPA: ribosomal L7Ae/L30e/S12e/Gadd45 family protein [Bacillota bacterium]|nr:ribosomal L7Ae/L30e/S12e/Gadd45 family protein [Bacillota bacterium]HPJ23604.1 ribosomal L7Ae/L30e/S12e/Gadd45 family protein [Bacillota bacterium]
MNKDKVLQYLGLAKRANKIVSGETSVLEYIKKKDVYLVFLASDAMSNTTKRITDKTHFYNVSLNQSFNTDELNKAIGTSNRKVVGITDKNFTNMILSQLDR